MPRRERAICTIPHRAPWPDTIGSEGNERGPLAAEVARPPQHRVAVRVLQAHITLGPADACDPALVALPVTVLLAVDLSNGGVTLVGAIEEIPTVAAVHDMLPSELQLPYGTDTVTGQAVLPAPGWGAERADAMSVKLIGCVG